MTVGQVIGVAKHVCPNDAPEQFQSREAIEDIFDALNSGPAAPKTFAAGLAHQLPGLLSAMPFDATRICAQVVIRTVEGSGARWTLDPVSTALQLEAWMRSDGPLRGLQDWLATHIVYQPPIRPTVRRALGSSGREDQLRMDSWVHRGADGAGRPCVLLSNPLSHLMDGRLQVGLLEDQVARGLEAGVSAQAVRVGLRLLHPSLDVVENRRPRDGWLEEVERLSSDEADAVVTTDVNRRAPGYGTAREHDSLQPGIPGLLLVDQGADGHSRLLLEHAEREAWKVVRYRNAGEIPGEVAYWLDEVYELILAQRRHRIDTRFLFAREHATFARLVSRALQAGSLGRVLEQAKMKPARLERLLDSREAWAGCPWQERRTLLRALTGRVKVAARRTSPALPDVNDPKLRAAAKRTGWSKSQTAAIHAAVTHELSVAGAAHRLTTFTEEEWIAAYERTFGTR